MTPDFWLMWLIIFTAMFFSAKRDKLTWAGAVTGGIIGYFIFLGAGFAGIAMIGSFFLLGTLATSWKIKIKQDLGVAEKNKGRRTTGQVIANGGIAGLAGLLSFAFPEQRPLLLLMMAAAIASATADTLSSELGTLYGKKFYNILSFEYDKRGENGVVSIEGTLIGIAGGLIIAVIYAIAFGWSSHIIWIVVAATVGNISDSILGATLERRDYLNNDGVNLINTLIAAMVALVLVKLFD